MGQEDQFFEIWSPNQPAERCAGWLSFGQEGTPMLRIATHGFPSLAFMAQERIPVLFGVGQHKATFVEILRSSHSASWPSSLCQTIALPKVVLVGRHVPEKHEGFCSIKFSLSGYNAWETQRHLSHGKDANGNDQWTVIPVDVVSLALLNGISLSITRDLSLNSSVSEGKELALQRETWFQLTFPHFVSLDEALGEARKLVAFLEYASEGSLDFSRVFVYPDYSNEGCEVLAQWIKGASAPSLGHWFIHHSDVTADWSRVLNAWWQLYEKMPFAIDSYRSCIRRTGLTMELKFISIVGALEAFHRAMNPGTNIKLRARLEDLSSTYSPVLFDLFPMQDVDKVVSTRDHIAHQTIFPNQVLVPPENRWAWFRRLVAAFEMCVLSHLDFPDSKINQIAEARWHAIQTGFLGEWDFSA